MRSHELKILLYSQSAGHRISVIDLGIVIAGEPGSNAIFVSVFFGKNRQHSDFMFQSGFVRDVCKGGTKWRGECIDSSILYTLVPNMTGFI